MTARRVRLIHVMVQPVLVADDGETLEALQVEPITVPAADWERFAAEVWPGLLAAAEADLNPQAEAS